MSMNRVSSLRESLAGSDSELPMAKWYTLMFIIETFAPLRVTCSAATTGAENLFW